MKHIAVINDTQGTTIATLCRVASSLRDRTVGLLGTSQLPTGQGLFIERSPSIHMFFMRYAIDVVFVDGSGKITRTVEDLKQWRVVWWARGARDCIELPVGTIRSSRSSRGDELRFVEVAGTDTRGADATA